MTDWQEAVSVDGEYRASRRYRVMGHELRGLAMREHEARR